MSRALGRIPPIFMEKGTGKMIFCHDSGYGTGLNSPSVEKQVSV